MLRYAEHAGLSWLGIIICSPRMPIFVITMPTCVMIITPISFDAVSQLQFAVVALVENLTDFAELLARYYLATPGFVVSGCVQGRMVPMW